VHRKGPDAALNPGSIKIRKDFRHAGDTKQPALLVHAWITNARISSKRKIKENNK